MPFLYTAWHQSVYIPLSVGLRSQDVAIKILRNVQDDSQQYQEFLQVGGLVINNHDLPNTQYSYHAVHSVA